jgi:hypothetical protein
MERTKRLIAYVISVGKVVGVIAGFIGIVTAVFAMLASSMRVYAYLSTRADATELAVVKTNQMRDHELWVYIARRLDDVASQFNHQALTGKVPYVVPPPAPAEVLGPQLPPKGNAPR